MTATHKLKFIKSNYSKMQNNQLAQMLKIHPILINRILIKNNIVRNTEDVATLINYTINLNVINDGTDSE